MESQFTEKERAKIQKTIRKKYAKVAKKPKTCPLRTGSLML
jgi:hypothetical protein